MNLTDTLSRCGVTPPVKQPKPFLSERAAHMEVDSTSPFVV